VGNNPLGFVDPLGLYYSTCEMLNNCSSSDPPTDIGMGWGYFYDWTGASTFGGYQTGGGGGGGGSTCYYALANPCGKRPANNQNVAKSVTSQCLAEYNGSTAAKGVQFFSLYHLATDLRNAWAEWTLLPAGKYALAKTASWISGQIGTTEFLSVTGATSGTVIPSATTAVVDLAETAGKAGAAAAIVAGTGLDVLANAGCATVGRQAAGQMTPLPPGWESSF
jgi:hypothetical protein